MATQKFKKFVEKVEQFLNFPNELRRLIHEVKSDLNVSDESCNKKNVDSKKGTILHRIQDILHRIQDWVNKYKYETLVYIIFLPPIFLAISFVLYRYRYRLYYCDLFFGKTYLRDIIVNNDSVGKTGIQVLIGLLAVIIMAGVFFLMDDNSYKKDVHVHTGIIKLSRIIIFFIFIFICLEFFKCPFANFFILVSLSFLLGLVWLYLKELFRG